MSNFDMFTIISFEFVYNLKKGYWINRFNNYIDKPQSNKSDAKKTTVKRIILDVLNMVKYMFVN